MVSRPSSCVHSTSQVLLNSPGQLLPSIVEVARGRAEFLEVYGEDYSTHDGSCVRDYVHMRDVADALVLALEAARTRSAVYNVGFGAGYSVLEVVEMARQVTRQRIPTEAEDRRRGEPGSNHLVS